MLKAFLVFVIIIPGYVMSQSSDWIQHNDINTTIKNGPPYTYQAATFWFYIGTKGYVGITSDTSNGTFLFEFDATTNSWTQKASMPGKFRKAPFFFSTSSRGYAGGGWNYPDYFKDFWEYDPVADSWTKKADLPSTTWGCSGFSLLDKGYVVLGYNVTSNYNSRELWQYDPITNTWTKKTNFPGIYRDYQTAFTVNNKAYTGLGYATNCTGGCVTVFYKDIWEYDPLLDSWTKKADYPGPNRYGIMSGGNGNVGYLGMGEAIQNEKTASEFWQFNPLQNAWTKKKDFFDDSRTGPACFSLNGKLYAGLGSGRAGNINPGTWSGIGVLTDLWEYDTVNDKWSEKRPLQEYYQARCSFKVNGKGYVLLPKYNYNIHKLTLALFEYDTANKSWQRKADYPSTIISWGMGSFTIADKAYIVSGTDSSFKTAYKNVYEYDPTNNKWTQKADFPGDGRRNIVTFAINGKGYAGLGWGAKAVGNLPSSYKLDDFWEYNPSTNQWIQKASLSLLNEVSFFGTISNGYVLDKPSLVYQFDPAINSWMQKKDFPGRIRTSALGMNIGNKGYVFGGTDVEPVDGYYIYLKDIWEYNADEDSWTINTGFPGYERTTGIGFSTGNKLFFGAGFNQTKYFNDWWEYTPVPALVPQYVFKGDGNWSNPVNWLYNTLPPSSLPEGSEIIINPPFSRECILDTQQIIQKNAKLTVGSAAKMKIAGDLKIQ